MSTDGVVVDFGGLTTRMGVVRDVSAVLENHASTWVSAFTGRDRGPAEVYADPSLVWVVAALRDAWQRDFEVYTEVLRRWERDAGSAIVLHERADQDSRDRIRVAPAG